MPAKPPRRGIYRFSNVRDTGRLIYYCCGGCNRKSFYDPADMITVFGDGNALLPPFPCSACGHGEAITIALYTPQKGDYGRLPIRRPGRVKRVQTWKTVKLGDRVW